MALTTKLISIFQIVNDWLKFAEAKNAVLLAFSGAGVTIIVTYLSTISNLHQSLYRGLLVSIFLCCCSSLICSLSFLPKTNLKHILWFKKKLLRKSKVTLKDTDNFYYFYELKNYSCGELLDSINRLYFKDKIPRPYEKEDLDIAAQIIANSEITSKKLELFVIALWALIFSIISVLIVLLASIF